MRTVGGILLLLGLLLAGGGAGYLAYFKTPDIPTIAPTAATRAPLAQRLFLFIIDGFAADPPFPDDLMPTFARLGREGARGVAKTSSMSLTAPCVFSLGTGRPGTLTLGILDFHAPPAHVESVPSLMVAAGKKIALAGDTSWKLQFGWLAAPEDMDDHPEPGITLNPRVRVADRSSVQFLIPKLRDPAYGLLVVHVSSADSVGHVVTPSGKEYRDTLAFVDELITEAVRDIDANTIVLITGDHGMGPRGTHGGRDDSATLTPYALWGPGIRAGATADVAQTSLPTTLAALTGLPMPIGEALPDTDLLTIDAPTAVAIREEFLARKLAAARVLAPDLELASDTDPRVANARLNEVLFGSTDTRAGWRLLTGATFSLAAILALLFAQRSAAAHAPQPSMLALLIGALVVPAVFAGMAELIITWRSALPLQPDQLARIAATLLGAGGVVFALMLYRSAALRARLLRAELALYFSATLMLLTPLLTSGWGTPEKVFQVLTVSLAAGGLLLAHRTREPASSRAPGWISMSLLLSAGYYGKDFSKTVPSEWFYLAPALAAVLAMASWNLGGLPTRRRAIGAVILLIGVAATVWWKTSDAMLAAALVLAAFAAGIAWAVTIRTDPIAASGLVIGVSALLAVVMASDPQESLVSLAAALAALVLTRHRLPLTQPRALYFAAVAALVLRVFLYFALGDQYTLSSIRTAAGFRLVESGLALPWVIAMLLLKYSIPWILILAAALPSLVAGGRSVTDHALRLLALGYVARFLAVAAVADPFRVLPHGMEGLVGVFAISWAELLTLVAAGSLLLALTPGDRASAAARPAPG